MKRLCWSLDKKFSTHKKKSGEWEKKIVKWLKEAASSQISNASFFTSTVDETETENKTSKEDFDDEYDTEITPGKKYTTIKTHSTVITPRVSVPFDKKQLK